MKRILLLLVAQVLTTFLFSQPKGAAKAVMATLPPRVKTADGIVEGVTEQGGIRSFKGIPFAAPPVGTLRWKEPQPLKPWQDVRKATAFGPRPMQTPVFGDMNFRSPSVSEDCLYLNVWAPQQRGKELLPVLVYFYGGGFVAGDGSEYRYDGESMARKGIVALTVNYRLGIFGFLSHPELSGETAYKGSGNYGFMDQAAALRWVKKNIAAFGGDPDKVTIAGESAGSISVSALMVSPLSKNLFARAIGESGSILGALPPVPLADGEKVGLQFAASIGAGSLAELRKLDADSLLRASTRFGLFRFPRTIDGRFFTKSPLAVFAGGEQAKVPLLVGWNSQEMDYHALLGNHPPTKENFIKAVRSVYGSAADKVVQVYNPGTDGAVEAVATALAGDRFIAYSTWKWADVHSRTSGKPVYRYYYEKPRPAMRPEMGNATPGLAGGVQKGTGSNPPAPPAKGAVHSAEIEYAMGNLATNTVYAWTEDDYTVSRTMQAYFANFVKTGDPNGSGLVPWPSIGKNAVPVMHINIKPRVEGEQNRDRYLFLDQAAAQSL